MRLKSVRRLIGTGVVLVVASVLTLFAPAPAHAEECYTVWVGSTPTRVCPWQ
jgi:hypothetical protein